MKKTLAFCAQIGALVLLCRACAWFVDLTGLPVPPNVLGIVILFLLLCAGVIQEKHLSEAAGFLLKHLVFFFIPVTVGLMNWGEVFARHAVALAAAIVVSSLLGLVGVGYLARLLHKESGECRK